MSGYKSQRDTIASRFDEAVRRDEMTYVCSLDNWFGENLSWSNVQQALSVHLGNAVMRQVWCLTRLTSQK